MIIENEKHPIERIMDNTLTKIKTFIDANTTIGAPITTADGISIIPISKIALGFLTGGGEYGDISLENYSTYPFLGGSGAGVSISPIGFLISNGESVKLVNIEDKNTLETILEVLPKITKSIFGNENSTSMKVNKK